MAQGRGSRRGVANLVVGAVLLLFGSLGFAAGCSSVDGAAPEALETTSQAARGCDCPEDNPCATFTCNLVTGTCTAKVLIKEGEACVGPKGSGLKGLCHLNLCCNGCVVNVKAGAPYCASADGTADTQCGETGLNCKNCTGDDCNLGFCSTKKTCDSKPVEQGAPCINTAGACHKGSCCKGCVDRNGACQPGGALDACGFSDGKLVDCNDCTDKDACTAEICAGGRCQYPAVPPGTSCGDGDICNGAEACNGTKCEDGKPLKCDDGEACTKDDCGPSGCTHQALTGDPCSDGDSCTTGDTCGADGKCAPGTPINCNDGLFCTSDKCEAGKCVNNPIADTTPCDDGNSCTTADKCTAGKCAGTSATGTDCNDDNPCSVDIQPSCMVDACTNNTPAAATVSCIADKCHEAGHCSGTNTTCVAGPEIDCNDGNPCTVDGCNPSTGCTHVNDASADCSDGDACTENDVCVAGNCGGKPKKCLALDACHEAGECDQVSGTCNDPRSDDGKACPGGACGNGVCVLDPNAGLGGEGAGGASGGAGESGEPALTGGAGPDGPGVGTAGQTAEPGEGGDAAVEEPERPFVRTPGGCSCEVPSGGGDRPLLFVGLVFLAGALGRRSRRGRLAA